VDASWLPLLRTVHVLGAIVFLAAHVVSMYVAFRLKPLRDKAQARRLLNLSLRAVIVAYIALLVVLVSGIMAGIAGQWFTSGRWWVWVALVLLIVVAGVMFPIASKPLMRVRWTVGAKINMKPDRIEKEYGAAAPTDADFTAALAAWNPWVPLAIGVTGLIVLLWLMLAKPF
jgi:MFS family permease